MTDDWPSPAAVEAVERLGKEKHVLTEEIAQLRDRMLTVETETGEWRDRARKAEAQVARLMEQVARLMEGDKDELDAEKSRHVQTQRGLDALQREIVGAELQLTEREGELIDVRAQLTEAQRAARPLIERVYRAAAKHIRAEDDANWTHWKEAGEPVPKDFQP